MDLASRAAETEFLAGSLVGLAAKLLCKAVAEAAPSLWLQGSQLSLMLAVGEADRLTVTLYVLSVATSLMTLLVPVGKFTSAVWKYGSRGICCSMWIYLPFLCAMAPLLMHLVGIWGCPAGFWSIEHVHCEPWNLTEGPVPNSTLLT